MRQACTPSPRARLLVLCLGLAGQGCAVVGGLRPLPSASVAARPRAHAEPDLVTAPPSAPAGGPVRHRVEAGQTLYRIARTYGLSPETLAAANGISDARSVAVGQELVIPGAWQPLAVPPPGAPIPPPPPPPQAKREKKQEVLRGDSPLAAAQPSAPLTAAIRAVAAPPRAPDAPREPAPRPVAGRAPPPALRAGNLRWPLRGVLYARFGKKGREPHDGIDLAAPEGTPVATADAGTVLYAGEQQGYGNIVIVQHGGGLVTLYAHNRDLRVKTGQAVRAGQVIATVGDSGKTSGPHLHFEVRQDGRPVDPLSHLGPIPERA